MKSINHVVIHGSCLQNKKESLKYLGVNAYDNGEWKKPVIAENDDYILDGYLTQTLLKMEC